MIDSLLAKDLLPEFVVRNGIRHLLKKRIQEIAPNDINPNPEEKHIHTMDSSPVAVNTQDANDQHYEVPAEFYKFVLGKNLKYSCGHYDNAKNLNEAELEMLQITCDRADLKNQQKILELGCGWGSLTLYMAEKYPDSKITAVSNSASQREHILDQAKQKGLTNIKVITCDMNDFNSSEKFDRCVSVEMFEHMRNYRKLMQKIANFLNDEGKLFIHIFVHKNTSYFFEAKDDTDWMSKYFFSGGMMPSERLLYRFQEDFQISKYWKVKGTHYGKTAEDWLKNLKSKKPQVLQLFKEHYPKGEELKWYSYWKIFFLSCAELWNYQDGEVWFVSHYLLNKKVNI